jgi:hypothetical protein
MRRFGISAVALLCAAAGYATVYEVGPGKPYGSISGVPWTSLLPGDQVLIYWQDAPYTEKWVICRQGTAEWPIVVRGVPNRFGELPVIDGSGAVTPPSLNYWGEERGILKIGGANTPPDTTPAHLVIESLDLRNGRPPFTYQGDDGGPHSYATNAAAIYVEKGHDITIRHCVLHDCGNGLFVGPFYGETSNLLVEGCSIYDNGITNRIYEHNNYTEANGIVFQRNRFGPLRPGCGGNNLKDRSAGCIIRYNWIEGGNRQLDLVDSDYFSALASYSNTHVYGNVLIEPGDDGNSQIAHYGGDSGVTAQYRKGRLHFFHNTVVSRRTGNTTLLRLSSNDEFADARNNIAYVTAAGSALAMLDADGHLDLAHNWFKTGWVTSHGTLNGTVSNLGGIVTGSWPGFTSESSGDYHLGAASACVGQATPLPSPPAWQYRKHQRTEPRPADADLGAFEHNGAVTNDDVVFIHHSCGNNWLDNSLHDALLYKDYLDERNDIYYGTDLAPDDGRPDSLGSTPGDHTDMQHWIRWFNDYLGGVKAFGCANGTNRIVLFKSCYPLSDIGSDGAAPGDPFSGTLSLANYKAVYRHAYGPGGAYTNGGYVYRPLEDVFAANPGILFIPVTAPPLHYAPGDATTDANAHRARLFNNWLKGDWLDAYNAAHPGLNNVAVFDWFDYLAFADDDPAHPNRLKAAYGGTAGDSHPNDLANTNSTAVFAALPDGFLDRAWRAFRHADYDGDGIPDWWEIANGGDPTNMTATSDTDGDHQTDRDEYVAGTEPTNAASRFAAGAAAPEGGVLLVTWPGVTNRRYAVYGATELGSENFAELATNLAATPPHNTYTDPAPPLLRFYRVGATLDPPH